MDGEWIGSIAGFLTTAAFFPQVWKTYRSNSAKDFAASWMLMMVSGVFLWIIYGWMIHSMPVIIANVVTFLCLAVLVWIKFKPKK